MGVNVISIKGFRPNNNQIFFIDNNIWIFILCPIGNHNIKKQEAYSLLLDSIQLQKSTIIVNSLVLSEFTNTYLKLDFGLWKTETRSYSASYKHDYLGSDRYIETKKAVITSLNSILKMATKWTDNLGAINKDSVFENLRHCDFNDAYYAELVATNKWILVSDDGDFSGINNLSFSQLKLHV